jgi:hypothetical protein
MGSKTQKQSSSFAWLPYFFGATYQNGKNVPNNKKIYQIATNYTSLPYNRPNGHIKYQIRPLQDPLKCTQIRIFGLKICHLATLRKTETSGFLGLFFTVFKARL